MTHMVGPINAPSAEVQQNNTAEVVWLCLKKILPTGKHPEEPLEPRDCCTIPEQRPALTRGWLEWMLPAEVMSGLKRTQVPSSSSSTTSTPLAGTSCASCSPSCRDKAQLENWTWLLQAQPQGTHRHSFLSKSVLAPKYFTLWARWLSWTDP